MSDSTPSPPSTSLVPHHVSRDHPFDGDDNHPLPIVPDASTGDRTTAAMTAGAVTAGGCDDERLKACIVDASKPLPCSPSLVPHGVTLDEIRLAHAPSSSPLRADDAPVANLFCGSRGVSQNKRLSLPREKSGHTPPQGRSTAERRVAPPHSRRRGRFRRCLLPYTLTTNRQLCTGPSSPPTAILPALETTKTIHPTMRIIIPRLATSPPPPSRLPKQKKIEPRIVLDRGFMTFLRPSTFDNQPFRKGQQPLYSDDEIEEQL
jgi:hypothetical protein